MRVRSLTETEFYRLIRTARREAPASMWLKGGTVLNVYTKEWQQVNVVVAGERIAYVGAREPVVDESTKVIDATGCYLVPGYIEPHAHPFQWYNPFTLADFALQTGTTALISDTLWLNGVLPYEEMADIMETLQEHPVKQYFWARLDPQIRPRPDREAFSRQGIARMLEHPLVIQGGELTDWQGVLQEDETLLFGLKYVRDLGKRMEGHHPGASAETLNIAAAAGITACHESITAEEVVNRLRLGMYVSLRHSSIRPDLPELVRGWKEMGGEWSSRMMLTSDGSTPHKMRNGLMNETLRVAIEAGVPPVEAYVMATLNPAVYYRLDEEIGGIAPGRIADILILPAEDEPTPELVIANGQTAAVRGRLTVPTPQPEWQRYSLPPVTLNGTVNREWFRLRHDGNEIPVLNMVNAVITKLEMERLSADADGFVSLQDDPDLALIVSIDPAGRRFTQALVRGYARNLEGLASTYTASTDWLVLGRDPEQMARALERVLELGGGVVLKDSGEGDFECALPLAGKISVRPMEELADAAQTFAEKIESKGYVHLDPIYSLLFFTATHLPFVRLTCEGLYDVKQGKVLIPSRRW